MDQAALLENQLQKDHSRILLFLQKAADLNLLQKKLPDHYTLINGYTCRHLQSEPFDICVTDYDSFQLYREFLIKRKKKEAPVLLPILLLAGDARPMQQNGVVWNVVDDIVDIPVPTKILNARVQSLLQSRQYSVDLKKKNDRLSLYEKALDATNNGVILTDARQPENPIIYCNKEFEDLTGYNEEEILGQNCRFLQADDRDQEAVEQMRSFIENGTEGKVVLRNYRKDGSMFWNEVKIAPIKNERNEITHFIGIQNNVTELVSTQERLRKEKKRYQFITEHATDMISLHAPDGTYLYVSPSSKKLTGYEPEELLGTSPFATMHPADREKLSRELDSLFDSEDEYRTTFRKQTKSGSYKWVEVVMRPIRDPESGEITEIRSATRDISERKEYEIKLRQEKEFSDTIINGMPVMFFMINKDLELIYWNEMLEKTLGYDAEELYSMHPLEIYQEKDRAFVRSKFREVLQEGSTEMEIEVLTKEGERQHHFITGKKFESDQGTYIIATGVDMTERIRAQKELHESEKRWQQLVDENPNLIQLMDKDFTIKFINPAGAKLFGKEPEELIGKHLEEFVSFDRPSLLKERKHKIYQGQSLEPKIYKVSTRDNRDIQVELHTITVQYQNERMLMSVGKDVSEQINYEEKLKQSLREKKVLLQEIHHRVKNNLAVVSGLLQIQRYNTDIPEVQKILSDSEMRIKTMALIHEKLYQSQSLAKIDLDSYLRDLVSSIKDTIAPQQNIRINFDSDSFKLNVNQAVPCALILNELVANAVEHAFPDNREGLIKIFLKKNDNFITVTVLDNGIGLPEDKISKKSMGFTIVETLCKQLETELSIDSGNGTVISFTFEKREVRGSSSAFLQ